MINNYLLVIISQKEEYNNDFYSRLLNGQYSSLTSSGKPSASGWLVEEEVGEEVEILASADAGLRRLQAR